MPLIVKRKRWLSYRKKLMQLEDSEVEAGLIKDKADSELIQIGYYNEFGTPGNSLGHPGIEERPFMRDAFASDLKKLKKKAVILVRGLLRKLDVPTGTKKLGEHHEETIRKTIIRFKNPPNKPSTIKKKGFNDPLIHKRNLVKGISSTVRIK